MRYDPVEAGKRIKQAREEMGCTQEDFAVQLHTTRNYISKLELGLRTPSVDLWMDISELTGISLDYLIKGTKNDSYQLKKEMQSLIFSLEEMKNKL